MASGSDDELRHLLEDNGMKKTAIERGYHLQAATSSTGGLREQLRCHAALARELREKEEKKSAFRKWKIRKKTKAKFDSRKADKTSHENSIDNRSLGKNRIGNLEDDIYQSRSEDEQTGDNDDNRDEDDDEDSDEGDHHHQLHHHQRDIITDVLNRERDIDVMGDDMLSRAQDISNGAAQTFARTNATHVTVRHRRKKFITIAVAGVLCIVVVVVTVLLLIFHPWS